eukprot:m.73472 g.73472  ORF g.73472 m.73472 type:complete len:244 (-) comp14460_c0_seq1:129-860(-)
MAHKAALIPPFRFGIVEDGVYRSACPVPRNFPFLERLHLRSIIMILPDVEGHTKELKAFAEQRGIDFLQLEVERSLDTITLTHADVVLACNYLLEPKNRPTLIHCFDGANTTGLVVMCLRRLQLYDPSFSTAEFCRFTRDGQISSDELRFVDTFRHEICLPNTLPSWLWEGVRTDKHPFLMFKYTEVPDENPASSSRNFLAAGEANLRADNHAEPAGRPDGHRVSSTAHMSATIQALSLAGMD